MRFMLAIAVFTFLSLTPPMALSKGKTARIEITGPGLDHKLTIQDPEIVDQFSIWNGPGVNVTVKGVRTPPAHLDPDQSEGRFIDWPRGIAEQPAGSPKYTVSFYCDGGNQGDRLCYRVNYAMGGSGGYIYLPSSRDHGHTNSIYHGVEGNWFYSTITWEKSVRPLLEK